MSRNYRRPRANASRIFEQRFDLPGATALGGINQLGRFLLKLELEKRLAVRFRDAKARWSGWRLDRVIGILLDAYFAGIERLYHFEDLETEPLLCARHGVERLPDLNTLYRDLRRFEDPELLTALCDVLREIVVEALRKQPLVTLDIDSTVETLYGRQEGAEIGPNPHKPGRPSYHPLIARDRLSDLIVHHVLRPGSAGTATDIVPFLHKTIDIVKDGKPDRTILARLDSGFESDDVMKLLERRGVGYVVKMRGTYSVTSNLLGLGRKAWRRVTFDGDGEIQVADLTCQREGWARPRRMVVLRKREMDQPQGHLFDRFGWSYSFFVTDRDWKPEDVARFYDKRADVERTICEAKHDLSIGHVPTASFGANAADLSIKVLARNLLVLFRDRGLKLNTRLRVATLRRRFITIAGRLVRHAGRFVLRLSPTTPLRAITAARPARA
ncbi:MAG TPA: IS1380 family transposase [Vicinamibacterales bacterium]|nr:IS1380 family transposase [Vicinamibacterales bacterium]